MKRLVPYRIRLWWSMRHVPTCVCDDPCRAPWLHDQDCPVYEACPVCGDPEWKCGG